MEDAYSFKCLEAYIYDSNGLTWILGLAIITIFWIILEVIFRQINTFFKANFVGRVTDPDLKYLLVIKLQLDNLHLKLHNLQKSYDGQSEVLNELKRRSIELESAVELIKSRLMSSQFPSAALNAAPAPGPPPPPPPPPPFSLVTPVVKVAPVSSAKTDKPKKPPTGPPQFSISQADISKMLQRLKKTSSTSRLLGTSNTAPRKTPPRRKLFNKTPGQSRRRSITALSPGEIFKIKTPLSSISPPGLVEKDVNKNDYDP